MNDFSKIFQVPKQLDGIVSKEEVMNLYLELPQSPDSIGGTSSPKPHDIAKYIDQIEASLRQEAKLTSSEKELKLQEQIKNIYEKQVKIQEQQTAIMEQTKENSKEQTKIQKAMVWIYVSIALFSLALIFATLVPSCQSNRILNKQTEIQEQQTEILQRANPSFEPFIEIVPDFEDLIIPTWRFASRGYVYMKRSQKTPATIDLTLYNVGQMNAQQVDCYYDDRVYNEFIAYLIPTHHFGEVLTKTFNRTILNIYYGACEEDEELCKAELIPVGMHNITLLCECIGCKNRRTFSVSIPFCSYNNKTKDCPDISSSQYYAIKTFP